MFKNANKPLMVVAIAILAALSILMAAFPDQSAALIADTYNFMTQELSGFFLVLGILAFAGTLFVVFTKYGDIKLGGADAKPHYSTFKWVAMVLCSALAAGILILGATEWMYYVQTPPFGIEPYTLDSYHYASAYGMFHWGFSAWSFYLIPALAIGYMYWNKKVGSIRISDSCLGVLDKNKPSHKAAMWVIDGVVALCYVGSLLTTIALGTPVMAELISALIGIPNSFNLQIGVIVLFCLFIILSVSRTIAKGMAVISDFNVKLAIAFLLFMLITGPTFFILNNFVMAIGTNIQDFWRMSFYTDSIAQTGFIQGWTVFYWSWYVGLTLLTGVWNARVSYGRSFREIAIVNGFWAPLACWVSFGILGNYGMGLELNKGIMLSETLSTSGQNGAILEMLRTLPLPTVSIIVFVVLIFFNLATTVTASGTSLAMLTSQGLKEEEEPNKWYKVFWSFLFLVIPVSILILEKNVPGLNVLNTIKSMTTVVAMPVIPVLVVLLWSFFKVLRKDIRNGDILKAVPQNKHRKWFIKDES